MKQKRPASSAGLESTYVLVETVGRALPCFRHGTDYILNLIISQVPRRIMRNIFLPGSQAGFRILVLPLFMAAYKSIHGCWIAPHTARHCLTAISGLGFTDKAGFSLMRYHIRRLMKIEPTSKDIGT